MYQGWAQIYKRYLYLDAVDSRYYEHQVTVPLDQNRRLIYANTNIRKRTFKFYTYQQGRLSEVIKTSDFACLIRKPINGKFG